MFSCGDVMFFISSLLHVCVCACDIWEEEELKRRRVSFSLFLLCLALKKCKFVSPRRPFCVPKVGRVSCRYALALEMVNRAWHYAFTFIGHELCLVGLVGGAL